MAPKKDATNSAAEQARADIANRPRQSQVRLVEYFNIISTLAADRLDEFFGNDVPAIAAVADKVANPVEVARSKADQTQLDRAVAALTNTDEKNGYAGYAFDPELFDEKTRPRKPRSKKTVVDKAQDLLATASEEDLAALRDLLAAQGLG